jgi:phosphoglucomutase
MSDIVSTSSCICVLCKISKSTVSLGELTQIQLPKSNVLQFITADGSKISARPSGTEPKIKFYFSVQAILSSKEDFERVQVQLKDKISQIISDMNLN